MSECFLCQCASDRVVWREMGYEGRRCRCGMVYTNPSPPAGDVDYTIDHHPEEFYSFPAEFKASWVARHCPEGRLLEVGCGEGSFLAAAQGLGYEVFGLEPHPDRARRVKEKLGIPVEQNFLQDSKLRDTSFDVVYHCDLLAHFPDPLKSLDTMSALLRPGGVLCFEVGILGGISPIWYRLVGQIGLGHHLWLYSEKALKSLLAQAGLHIEHTQSFGLVPQVVLGRAAGLFRRLLLSITRPLGRLHQPEIVNTCYYRLHYFLRYRLGIIAPRIGPQTILVVVRPEGDVAIS